MTLAPANSAPRYVLATWGARVGAAAIDLAIAWAIAFIVAIPFSQIDDPDSTTDDISAVWWLLVVVPLCTAYYALTMGRKGAHNGQTWGKQAVGIRVVRDNGQPVGLSTVLLRELLLKFVAGVVTLVGWIVDNLWPLGDRENRALHDLAASTHVVSTRAPAPQPPVTTPRPPRRMLAPAIERHLQAARDAERRIHDAIARARLPYAEVGHEVHTLMRIIESSSERAQLLYEGLEQTPVAKVEQRLAELEGTGKTELIGALEEQLTVQRRMDEQLTEFLDELERMVVELETIHGSLLNLSASTDAGVQQRLADQVSALRDEMASVAEGMSTAYD
ncbi:MAG TPA: RDD family protein [Solirubrobacter sp.]|nr:RDD family protein [Solirubrobacter sp.]